jgi:hypothetical protein
MHPLLPAYGDEIDTDVPSPQSSNSVPFTPHVVFGTGVFVVAVTDRYDEPLFAEIVRFILAVPPPAVASTVICCETIVTPFLIKRTVYVPAAYVCDFANERFALTPP